MTVAGKVQFDEDHVGRVLAPLSGPVVGFLAIAVGWRAACHSSSSRIA